jgi:hypothetical protein
MRWTLAYAVAGALAGAACGADGVTAPLSEPPISTPAEVPPPPELKLIISSVSVSRDSTRRRNGYEWLYFPAVRVSETSGRSGAYVVTWGAGPEGGPIAYYEPDPPYSADCDTRLYVPPGGTLDLSIAIPSGCGPSTGSTDPESSIVVGVKLRDDQGRTIELRGSIDVP